MQPGKYTAAIKDYGITQQPNSGDPQVYVKFECNGDARESMTWYGGLNAKVGDGKKMSQADVTLTVLKTMGFKGALMQVTELYDGPPSMSLNSLQDYELVVETDKWKDRDGNPKEANKIKYINLPGEGPGVGKKFESKADLIQSLAKMQQGGTSVKQEAPAAKDYLK
jgi:hypothetical protein